MLFACSFALLLAGCGSTAGTAPAPKPTVTLTASPTSITAGNSASLSVSATSTTQITITGSDGSSYTLQGSGGTQTVTPTATVTYTATATGPGGTATATATVTVGPATAPTVTMMANPTTVTAGTSSTLTVTATNATTVTVAGSDGSSYTLQPGGGTQSVTPTATTTYTATATGPGGTTTATATVTVTASTAGQPTVAIAADPTTITAGSSSTLTVFATNATQVTVTGSDGSSYTLQPTGGTQSVTPTATTTYTATATGAGGTAKAQTTVTVPTGPPPTVTITANPASIATGGSSTLTVTATNATTVSISGSDGTSYSLQPTGGTATVTPASTTTYTANATGAGGTITSSATVTVNAAAASAINHVIFMLQENHTFDNYFGMLNPYRDNNGFNIGADGKNYAVDGIDDKLNTISNVDDEGTSYPLFKFTTTCIDDESSAWLESYGDVNTYDFSATRPILMNGFVHTAEGYAKSCNVNAGCSQPPGSWTDLTGKRAMGYYDQGFLNYYYYMASQFAVSDRWFSPVASKSIDNRIATFTGGTTQGLTKDPGVDDHLGQLNIPSIFEELDQNHVSWKIYFTVTQGECIADSYCNANGGGGVEQFPATDFTYLTYSTQYLYENPTGAACTAPTVGSSIFGDTTNSYCVDPTHIAPINDPKYGLAADMASDATFPSFAFIEAGFGNNDEHPGSGQSILAGQAQVSNIINSFMTSAIWHDSAFFLSYDEGGGPYDHVPPVPGHSNDNTDAMVGDTPKSAIPDIATIAVNPDSYNPCLPPSGTTATQHCDLTPNIDPGDTSTDAAANPNNVSSGRGFSAQLGFRVPNMVISPFTRKHYVSHIPMDHTAIIKFVENRFIGSSAHLTARDAAQPNLLDFFDFSTIPWSTPPTPPTPAGPATLGSYDCTPQTLGP